MTSEPLTAAVDFTKPAGTVHLTTSNRRGTFTYCTGRHMPYAVGTDTAVTCKACIAKAGRNGIDAQQPDGFDTWAASAGEPATTNVDGFETIAEFAFAVEHAGAASLGRLF